MIMKWFILLNVSILVRYTLSFSLARPYQEPFTKRPSKRWVSQVSATPPLPREEEKASFLTADDSFIVLPENKSSFLTNSETPIHDEEDDIQVATTFPFDYDGRLPNKEGMDYRCGFVCILGAPNMGKSTLLNALLKEDLCITTRRPQTTRHAILGVLTSDDTQVCLMDTPGVIETPAYKLQEGMMEAVMGAFYDSDVLLVVTDLFSTPIPDDKLFRKVQSSNLPVIVVINKIDLVNKANNSKRIANNNNDDDDAKDNERLDEDEEMGKTYTVPDAIAKWRSLVPNAFAIIPVAASEGPDNEGVAVLRKILLGGEDIPAAIRELGRPIPGMFRPGVRFLTDQDAKALLPYSPPLYEEEALTDRSERFFASEWIRQALLETLNKELPYCCEVRIDEFQEAKEGQAKPINRIKATIFVERDSQKLIVIGHRGEQIKQVGILARRYIENFLQERVFLQLEVKVNKNWRKNEDQLKEFGYLRR